MRRYKLLTTESIPGSWIYIDAKDDAAAFRVAKDNEDRWAGVRMTYLADVTVPHRRRTLYPRDK